MAIQVLPILKALGPIISTAGSVFAEWQRYKRAPGEVEAPAAEASELESLKATMAQNAHLIAELAEQLRITALQLEELGREVERQQRRFRRLAVIGAVAVTGLLILTLVLAG